MVTEFSELIFGASNQFCYILIYTLFLILNSFVYLDFISTNLKKTTPRIEKLLFLLSSKLTNKFCTFQTFLPTF